ncbi:MAG: hypothetical protein NT141_02700 [candidate division WWE3 bacterium]|nr:hypothetical protein [candidate division WWE3 bacterium]
MAESSPLVKTLVKSYLSAKDWLFIFRIKFHLLKERKNNAITYITRFYPFSLMFRRNIHHAYWVGAERILLRIDVISHIHFNTFIDHKLDRDSNYYYVTGKFENEPAPEIFKEVEEWAQLQGLVIQSCGNSGDGTYKFMAPVNQNWLKVLF